MRPAPSKSVAAPKKTGTLKVAAPGKPAVPAKAAPSRPASKVAPARPNLEVKRPAGKAAPAAKVAPASKASPPKVDPKTAKPAVDKKAIDKKGTRPPEKLVATPASRDGLRTASPTTKPVLAAKKAPALQPSKDGLAPKSSDGAKPAPKGKSATKSEVQPKAASRQSDVDPPLPKTNLTDKQLAVFKEMLLDKRRELLGDVRTLTKDALGRSRQDSSGDLSSMPIHMADLGTDNWEQDFTLGLIANEQQLVREIDEALQRIEEKTYGMCLATHKPISIARLKAKPWAKHCIEYARQRELGRY